MKTSASVKPAGERSSGVSEWVEVLRGGDRILIRPISPADIDMERTFIEGLSMASRRFRFLDSMQTPSPALLKQMTVINPKTDVAFIAVLDEGARDQQIGVGRFSAQVNGEDCEFSLTVSDKWQNKGVATHLMHHLLEAARRRGISRMHSSDAGDNYRMRRFAAHLRLDHEADPDDPTQVLYSIKVPASPP
jgi:GNAT superfamily N-acetyltransferase